MKNNIFFCVIFLIIYAGQIQAPQAPAPTKTVVQANRLPSGPIEIFPHLIEADKLLKIKGEVEEIHPTKNEALWIDRFITTLRNWLTLLSEISKLEGYRKLYLSISRTMFDECLENDETTPIEMRYLVKDNKGQEKIYEFNIIPNWVCVNGTGLGRIDLQLLKIHFERSKTPMQANDGEMVLRKDRIYDLKVELSFPWIIARIDHEMIQKNEERDPTEQMLEGGIMRFKLNDVKINMTIRLVEIDKRFITENPKTRLKYYFRLPELKNLEMSVRSVDRRNIQIQKKTRPEKPEGYVGKGIPFARAQKMIVDFTELFDSGNGSIELCERLKPVLVNKTAEAIMTAPNILSIAKHVVIAWDNPHAGMPPSQWTDEEIRLWNEAFYASYSGTDFIVQALNFVIVHFENVANNSKTGEIDLLEDRATDYKVGGLSVHDNGFDYTETNVVKTNNSK